MTKQIAIPVTLLEEIKGRHPFPWKQYNHPNGLIQVGDANNKEVDLFLLIKLGMAVGQGALAS